MTCCAGRINDLNSNKNISETVIMNSIFTACFLERTFNNPSNDTQVHRLCSCDSLVINVYKV